MLFNWGLKGTGGSGRGQDCTRRWGLSHSSAATRGGNQGSDLKKRLREKNAVEQQAGRETEGVKEDRQIREI